jgi:hypothetical protein
MELFNKALFLSQQKIFALTHWRVYTLMVNLFQILNQFVLLFRKNVIEKSSMIWRVFPLVKINTRISETPCIIPGDQEGLFKLAIQLRTFFYSAIYNTATGYVLWVYLTDF